MARRGLGSRNTSIGTAYKRAGAKYFATAVAHRTMTISTSWASTYQPWNSVAKIGPKRDIVGGWAKAVRNAMRSAFIADEPRRPRVELVSSRTRRRSEWPAGWRALRRLDEQGRRQGTLVGGTRPAGSLRAISSAGKIWLAAETGNPPLAKEFTEENILQPGD